MVQPGELVPRSWEEIGKGKSRLLPTDIQKLALVLAAWEVHTEDSISETEDQKPKNILDLSPEYRTGGKADLTQGTPTTLTSPETTIFEGLGQETPSTTVDVSHPSCVVRPPTGVRTPT